MKRNNIYMAAVAIAVAMAFMLPSATVVANVGAIGVISNIGNTGDIENIIKNIEKVTTNNNSDSSDNTEAEATVVSDGLGVKTVFKNTGISTATGVEWSTSVAGGLFGTINKVKSHITPTVVVGQEIPILRGWPAIIQGDIVLGPPALGDLDNDGTLEIILGSSGTFAPDSGKIYVFKYDGTQMNNFPVDLGSRAGGVTALGDINNDNYLEIVDNADSKTYVLSYEGEVLSGWPVAEESSVSRPTIADIDGDGFLDILLGGHHHATGKDYIYAYDQFGDNLPGNWPAYLTGPPEGMQAIGDIDGDGGLEIIVGTSRHGGIYAFDDEGNIIDGWPVETGKRFPAPITLADLDQDGDLEIIGSADYGHFNIYVYHHNGTKAFQVNNGNGLYQEIVPADLDDDEDLEILTVTDGQINAFHHDGQLVNGWPVFFDGTPGGGGGSANGEPSVLVGDIDDDGESEILISSRTTVKNLIYAWKCNGTLLENFPIEFVGGPLNRYCNGAMALGDLDGDGDIEIVFVGYQQSLSQGIYRTEIYVFDLDGQYNAATMQWPQFHHDAQHTGCYVPWINNPPNVPTILGLIKGKAGIAYQYTFVSIDSEDDDVYYWIDWGDSTVEQDDWIGPFLSGEKVKVNHTWSKGGTYNITAKAKDVYGQESDWGFLEVTMPKNKVFYSLSLKFVHRYFPCLSSLLKLYTGR